LSKSQRPSTSFKDFELKPKEYPKRDPKIYGSLYTEYVNKRNILFMKILKENNQNIKINNDHKRLLEIDDDIQSAILEDTTSLQANLARVKDKQKKDNIKMYAI